MSSPSLVAVDGFRNYVFICEKDTSTSESVIRGYRIHTDVTNFTTPIVNYLDEHPPMEAYRGGKITGMSVDDIRGFLYIADTTEKKILIFDYDKRSMRKNNQTNPFLVSVYSDIE